MIACPSVETLRDLIQGELPSDVSVLDSPSP